MSARARRLRVGIATGQRLGWEETATAWRRWDELGFHSLWVFDHFIQPSRPEAPFFDGWTLLAALARETRRARVGVLVSCNTFRHPALLAKIAVTLDHVSGGRLEVGLGAGYYEPEHTMFGVEFPAPGQLVSRFGEAVEVIDLLLRNDVSSYEGRHFRLSQARSRPRPLQQPRPPLVVGAKKPRMLRICARRADVWNAGVSSVDEVRRLSAALDDCCAEIGRDPRELRRSVYYMVSRLGADPWASLEAFRDVSGRYREAGIDEFIVDPPAPGQEGVLEQVAASLLAPA